MKKLSRKLSRKEGGFFKGSHDSEERDPVKEESIIEELDSKVTIKVTSSEKPRRVQRSVTIDQTNSDSPANISRRKFSEKRTLTLPPTGQLCHICYGEFTQPKQLPCQHTFCQNCLQKFVNPKLMVECPTCREVGSALYTTALEALHTLYKEFLQCYFQLPSSKFSQENFSIFLLLEMIL